MEYKVMDIARFIINYSNEKKYLISNLKLQKLLYFVQAYYLGLTDKHNPCFSEDFQAWDFGPVMPKVYQTFKKYGASNIPEINEYITEASNIFDKKKVKYNIDTIDITDRFNILKIVDAFSSYSSTDLVKITQKQSPWINAYVPYENKKISKESIKDFFITARRK